MSMCRLVRIDRARKPQGNCGRCGDPINRGDPYVWWKGRFTPKYKRCGKKECQPQPWERETNPLRADHLHASYLVGDAQNAESATDASDALVEARDLVQGVVETLEDRIDTAQQYEGLSQTEQYAAWEYSRDDLQGWLDSVEDWISTLDEFGEEGEADTDEDGEPTDEFNDAIAAIEDLPDLDLGA